jgi:hypothetical protein
MLTQDRIVANTMLQYILKAKSQQSSETPLIAVVTIRPIYISLGVEPMSLFSTRSTPHTFHSLKKLVRTYSIELNFRPRNLPIEIKELLTPRRAVICFIALTVLFSTAVKRWENSKEVFILGRVMRVWEAVVSLSVDYSGVLICINLKAKVSIIYQLIEYRPTYKSDI